MNGDGLVGYAFIQGGNDDALADFVGEAESGGDGFVFVGRVIGRYSHFVKVEAADLETLDDMFRRLRAASPGSIIDTDLAADPFDKIPPIPPPIGPPPPVPFSGDDPLVAVLILVDRLVDGESLARLGALDGVLGATTLLSGRTLIKIGAEDLGGVLGLRRMITGFAGAPSTSALVMRASSAD